MGGLSEALTALAGLDVDGVKVRYAWGGAPSALDAAALPAALTLPRLHHRPLFGERGGGFEVLSLGTVGALYSVEITELLAVAPEGRHPQDWGAVSALVEAYFAALRGDVLLGGALRYPPRVMVELGTYAYGSGRYIGAALRHVWTLDV